MRIQPLCDSPDLGAAIGFAQKKYAAVSKGLRPSTRTHAYKDLLCRFVLAADPSDDYVQILPGRRLPQEILFLKNDWDVETLPTGDPFYGPNSDPDHFFKIALGGTATIVVLGGPSKKPVVLTSSNPAVCSVTPVATTYTEAAALAETTLEPPFDDEDTCTPAWFTLTVNAYGRTTITMTQDGTAKYLAVSLFGGNFTFGPMPVEGHHFGEAGGVAAPSAAVRSVSAPTKTFVSARGQGASRCRSEQRVGALVTAVAAPASRASRGGSYVGKARAVALAGCRTARGGAYRGKAGAVGQAASQARASSLAKPKAISSSAVRSFYECHEYTSTGGGAWATVPLGGVAVRGGVLTFAMSSWDTSHISATAYGVYTNPPYAQFLLSGICWYGYTWIEFVVKETKDGITVISDPARVTIYVQPPPPLSFEVRGNDVQWTGGTAPFKFYLRGGYTNLSFGSATATRVALVSTKLDFLARYIVAINGTPCTSGGYVEFVSGVGTVAQASSSVSLSSLGLISCSALSALHITSASGWVVKWAGGTPPYRWDIINSAGATGAWGGDTTLNLAGNGCYYSGGGVLITDAKGATAFAPFGAGFGPPSCGPTYAWVTVWEHGCDVPINSLSHITWTNPNDLSTVDEGTGFYTYRNGYDNVRVTMAWNNSVDASAGGHSFENVKSVFGLLGIADPYAYWHMDIWEWAYGGLDAHGVEMGAVHVVKIEQYRQV